MAPPIGNSTSSTPTVRTDRPMHIGYAYPHWKAGRVAYAMDVLGFGLAESMAGGHQVELFAGGGEQTHEESYRVRIPWTKLDQRIGHLAERLRPENQSRPIASTLWPYLGYATSVAAAARRDHLDLVHVHIYDQLVPPIKRVSPSTRVVLHLHDHSQTQRDAKVVGKNLEKADAIVACSEFIANRTRDRFPGLADRITAIQNGTPVPADPEPMTDHPHVVFVGRISPEKGVHVLAAAFRQVVERFPHARLTLVGPHSPAPREFVDPFGNDPLFDDVRNVWGGRKYPDFVRTLLGTALANTDMVGGLSHDETTAYVRSASMLVMPSLWDEPFGMPTIEAMAMGRAVVATRAGAFPEIVDDGVTGRLVEKADVDGLGSALIELLAAPDRLRAMGVAGHARVAERFSWDGYIDQWDELYRGLAG